MALALCAQGCQVGSSELWAPPAGPTVAVGKQKGLRWNRHTQAASSLPWFLHWSLLGTLTCVTQP